jgi:hypothetical protein
MRKKIDPLAGFLRVLMMVRTGTITYSQNSGILLPGTTIHEHPGHVHRASMRRAGVSCWASRTHDFSGDLTRDFATYASRAGLAGADAEHFQSLHQHPHRDHQRSPDPGALQEHAHRADANRTISENHSSFYRWSDSLQTYVERQPARVRRTSA